MENTFNIIITVFAVIGFGFFLSRKGIIDEKIAQFITKLVVTYVVPCILINNMMTYFTLESLKDAGFALLAPFLSILATFGIAHLLIPILKIPKGQRGVFAALFGFSNTIFVGLPVCIAIFGDAAAPLALLFFAANSVLFWALAAPGIRRDAPGDHNSDWKETLQKIFTPALITLIVCFILIFLRVSLPKFVMDTTKIIGGMSTPLALTYIGYVLASTGLKNLKISRNVIIVCIGRFLISPIITFALMKILHIEGMIADVSIIQSAMPAMAQVPIVAALYGSDHKFAATCTSFSTLLGLLFLPVYMYLFTLLGI